MRTELARLLLAHEAATDDEHAAEVAGRVYDRLHRQISPLIGSTGMKMIWVRAARLSQVEFAWLEELTKPVGASELRECLLAQDHARAAESAIFLFATFLGFLATLIGERLLLQIIRRAWPMIDETPREENTT
jgi:hypothetical protein